ncbi:MAG: asparaginase [Anaerolineae bacterium]|nr:asparaginase [Anaerolineae bacterium]
MTKRIYVAYTGGTIGMKLTDSGYAPEAGFLSAQIAAMPEFKNPIMPKFDLHEYNPLLDSANMTHHNWREIAEDIAAHYEAYDGFIVLHGTDTMAYTASALPFMLSGLQKPVILTGSQIPLCEVRSDARENLITALLLAANYAIPEVCLYFGSTLLRGCRATKISAGGFDAFDSPNYPPLGVVGIDIDIDWDHVLPVDRSIRNQLTLQPLDTSEVSVLRLFPGLSAHMLRNMLQPPLKGLIIEAYGVGNGPEKSRDVMDALTEASERGVVIVVCSQCLRGTVDLNDYSAGSALARAGAISGYDMTTETALAKLRYLFSLGLSSDDVRAAMQTDLVGELTRPDEDSPYPNHVMG